MTHSRARQPVQLAPGQSKQLTFTLDVPRRPGAAAESKGLFQSFGQVSVRLMTSDKQTFTDALLFNNTAYASFAIREDSRRVGRKLLTLAQDPKKAWIWEAAFKARASHSPTEAFDCEVRSLAEGEKLTVKDLERYQCVCLFQAVKPSPALWNLLHGYVQGGGGLIIVPAGEEIEKDEVRNTFNKDATAANLLPARLEALVTVPRDHTGVSWTGFDGNHPLLLPFRQWSRTANPDFGTPNHRPIVNRYWKVKPLEKDEGVIAWYAVGKEKPPALVEKSLDQGRVVLFTVVMDDRQFDRDNRDWHNYWKGSSFGLTLVNQVASYLAGDISALELNFQCGQLVTVPLPADTPPRAVFRLEGRPESELTDSERTVQLPKELGEPPSLALPQAVVPGNFRLASATSREANPPRGEDSPGRRSASTSDPRRASWIGWRRRTLKRYWERTAWFERRTSS